MARIITTQTMLMPMVAGQPTIAPDPKFPSVWLCKAAPYQLNAPAGLEGKPFEHVAGWTLGFVQLYYLGSIFARYRGSGVADGSALIARGHHRLCRDTDQGAHEIWYDSLFSGGIQGPMGTNRLPKGTKLHDNGTLGLAAQHWSDLLQQRRRLRQGGHGSGFLQAHHSVNCGSGKLSVAGHITAP